MRPVHCAQRLAPLRRALSVAIPVFAYIRLGQRAEFLNEAVAALGLLGGIAEFEAEPTTERKSDVGLRSFRWSSKVARISSTAQM